MISCNFLIDQIIAYWELTKHTTSRISAESLQMYILQQTYKRYQNGVAICHGQLFSAIFSHDTLAIVITYPLLEWADGWLWQHGNAFLVTGRLWGNQAVAVGFPSERVGYAELWCSLCCSLQWRHNEHHGVSNHQRHHCLLNCWYRPRSKKTSKLRVTGLCAGNSPVTGEFPAQKASKAENVSIWWRHHG